MMIFVTPQDTDNRFVIYLSTKVCQVLYQANKIVLASTMSRIQIIKDFFLNYGIKDLEVQENGKDARIIVHDKDALMQIEDKNQITGIKVPILTII